MQDTRILIISTVGLTNDGITNVIISYLRALDRTGLSIYVANTIVCDDDIRNEIELLGCKIIDLPNRKADTIKYLLSLYQVIRKYKFNIIHVHGNSGTMALELFVSFMGGCKKRIAHGHSTQTENPKVDKILRPLLYMMATHRVACGEASGKWLYKNRSFIVLRNGRDCDRYSFNPRERKRLREQLGWEEKLIIGHVGSFLPVKNHEFIVEVFRKLSMNKDNVELALVGNGPLQDRIVELTSDMRNKVHFLGVVKNIPDILQAMDIMVLPSHYEGVPLVVLEWQLSGLPCLVSKNVDSECAATNLIKFLPIENASDWAKEIEMITPQDREKKSKEAVASLKEAGFDIFSNAKKLREIYLQ